MEYNWTTLVRRNLPTLDFLFLFFHFVLLHCLVIGGTWETLVSISKFFRITGIRTFSVAKYQQQIYLNFTPGVLFSPEQCTMTDGVKAGKSCTPSLTSLQIISLAANSFHSRDGFLEKGWFFYLKIRSWGWWEHHINYNLKSKFMSLFSWIVI